MTVSKNISEDPLFKKALQDELDITQVQTDVAQTQSDIVTINNELDTIDTTLDNLDTLTSTTSSRITSLEDRTTVVEGDIVDLDNRVLANDGDISTLDGRVDNLEQNQVTGVVVYSTLAELPATGTLNVSYKVSNDSTPTNNGYYHWNGSSYIKDANLATGIITSTDTQAVSGSEAYKVDFANFATWLSSYDSSLIPKGFARVGDSTPAFTLNHTYKPLSAGTIFGQTIPSNFEDYLLIGNGTTGYTVETIACDLTRLNGKATYDKNFGNAAFSIYGRYTNYSGYSADTNFKTTGIKTTDGLKGITINTTIASFACVLLFDESGTTLTTYTGSQSNKFIKFNDDVAFFVVNTFSQNYDSTGFAAAYYIESYDIDSRSDIIRLDNEKISKDPYNYFDKSNVYNALFNSVGAYGFIGTSGYWAMNDYIDVSEGINIIANQQKAGAYNVVYDADKNIIRTFTTSLYTYQSGDYYVRYSGDSAGTMIIISGSTAATEYVPYLDSKKNADNIGSYFKLNSNTEINAEERFNDTDKILIEFSEGETITAANTLTKLSPRFVKQLYGKTIVIKMYVKTGLTAAQFNKWNFDTAVKTGDTICFSKTHTVSYLKYSGNLYISALTNYTAGVGGESIEITGVTYTFNSVNDLNEYKAYLDLDDDIKDLNNYHMNYMYVSASYDDGSEGWGATKFASMIVANNAIVDNHQLNRHTVILEDTGTTDMSSEINVAGDLSGTSMIGIIIKNPYVYYESADIEDPESYELYFDGSYGLAPEYDMSQAQCMRLQFFYTESNHSWKGHIKGFKMRAKNGRYCLHPETGAQGYLSNWLVEYCIFEWFGSPNSTTWNGNPIGIGISAGETGKIKNCKILYGDGSSIVGHNNGYSASVYPDAATRWIIPAADMTFENVDFDGIDAGGWFDNSPNQTFHDMIRFINCKNINQVSCSGNWRAQVIGSDITTDNLVY